MPLVPMAFGIIKNEKKIVVKKLYMSKYYLIQVQVAV